MAKIKMTLFVTYTKPGELAVIEAFDLFVRDDDAISTMPDGYEATDLRIAEWEVDES